MEGRRCGDPGVRFERAADVVTRRIADETLVVPLAGGVGDLDSIYTLSDVGGRVWDLLDGRRGPGEIAGMLCREYEVGTEEAARDVVAFLAALEAAGLVRAA